MIIRPRDCDKARSLNEGKIYLDKGDNFLDPEANLINIQFIGVGRNTTIIVSPSNTKLDDKKIQDVLDRM
jgi:hypothetical protein